MRALVATAALSLFALAGCDTANEVADAVARDQAKAAINAAVESKIPGVNAVPVTDCVIDNSSAGEIFAFATNAAAGRTDANVELLLEVAQRPDTIKCLSENALPALLAISL